MQRVAAHWSGHELMSNECCSEPEGVLVEFEQRQITDKLECCVSVRERSIIQFVNDLGGNKHTVMMLLCAQPFT